MVERLCPTCALCCNGVLFADVRLRPGDDAPRLTKLGVPLQRRGALVRFSQPCSCLDHDRCRIYADRPERCRTFECRILQRAQRGEITESAALKCIRQARRKADAVRAILRELGDTDEHLPLTRRYERMMRQPMDLSADERLTHLRGQLMIAVADLMTALQQQFLS